MNEPVYASDPNQAPDTDFEPGELSHLVVGNQGRLLDSRRTPVTVTAVTPTRGEFTVEIGAFEDKGAHWDLPLHDVHHFQFTRNTTRTNPTELTKAAARFNQDLTIPRNETAHQQTEQRINETRKAIKNRIEHAKQHVNLAQHIATRTGNEVLYDLHRKLMADHGVADLDDEFARTFVSNPASGETVKGHAITMAELGLCNYHGKTIRNPNIFTNTRSKEHRATHIITRLAFQRELWADWHDTRLYRGAAVTGPIQPRAATSFVSATMSREVAMDHFEGGPTTTTAILWRQNVPINRMFMTFLETPAMNDPYAEAEALLIGDPTNSAF